MKEYYYYFRDENKAPRLTVCLLKDGKYIARGVAICSERDPVNKAKGRTIAKGRAVKALKRKKSDFDGSQVVRSEAYHQMYRCTEHIPFFFKSTFHFPGSSLSNIEFTEFERRLLSK